MRLAATARERHHSTRCNPPIPQLVHVLGPSSILAALRRFLAGISILLVLSAVARRVRGWLHASNGPARRIRERQALPSLYERHPAATSAPRRPVGLRSVPLDQIVGTMRDPSQNTADFLPLPRLRGENWRARWQRITRANDRLTTLPPVDLVQVGDEYYVADGHNRVAAARQAGAIEIDADVTQLLVPGVTRPDPLTLDAGALYGADDVRRASRGRLSRTLELRPADDFISRRDLAHDVDPAHEGTIDDEAGT